MCVTAATIYPGVWCKTKQNNVNLLKYLTKMLFWNRNEVCARLSVPAAITVPSMPCRPCSAAAADTWLLFSAFHQASLLLLALQDLIVELVTVLKHWDLHSISECKAAVDFLHQHIYQHAEWECTLHASCMVAWSVDAVLSAGALQNRNTGTTADS